MVKINRNDKENIDKYYLKNYCDFSKFIEFPDDVPLDCGFVSVGEKENIKNYDIMYKLIEKYRKEKFNKCLKKTNIEIEKYVFDNFYFSSCILILSYLKLKDFDKNPVYENFYKNVCIPLFGDNNKINKLIQIFYDPKKFENVKKKFKINSEHIPILL